MVIFAFVLGMVEGHHARGSDGWKASFTMSIMNSSLDGAKTWMTW